jgi:hypothetical protein
MPLLTIGARLRAICLALPEAFEEQMRRGPSYRVGEKIFALERPWGDCLGLWCKVPQGTREIIIDAEPARFLFPPISAPRAGSGSASMKRPIGARLRRSPAAAIGSSPQSGWPCWRLEARGAQGMSGITLTDEAARQLEKTYRTKDIVAQRLETIRRLDLSPGEKVLDVGCGPGFLCEEMSEIVAAMGSGRR